MPLVVTVRELQLSCPKKLETIRHHFTIGAWLSKDPRYKKLISLYRGKRLELGRGGSYSFLVKRNGEDERFHESSLLIANGHLRRRLEDILSPEELARRHQDYFWRVYIGPSYRAGMIWMRLFLDDGHWLPDDSSFGYCAISIWYFSLLWIEHKS